MAYEEAVSFYRETRLESSMLVRDYSGKAGLIYAEFSEWARAKPLLQVCMAAAGVSADTSNSPGPTYWYWLSCEQTGDSQGIAAVKAASLGQIGMPQGLATTGQHLVDQGVTAKDIVTFRAGLWYINSGEDGDRGLRRGISLVKSVVDKHPTNAWLNYAATFGISTKDGRDTYAGRAYRQGNPAMRAELLKRGFFGAHREAKAMGHAYDHRMFRHSIRREDGTWYDVEDP